MSSIDPNHKMPPDEDKMPGIESQAAPVEPGSKNEQHRLPWLGGAMLILIGVILLMGEFTSFYLHNWWALFILIPAVNSFANAWSEYQKTKRFVKAVRKPLVGGVIFTVLALILLLGLDFGRLWPIFLIIGGAAMLVTALSKD
ncbi:MAG: hypothetical protein LLG44_13335 [Chloroflexi bacterium]|nr:hypothetical protein [Chloroflexota bacterium]